MRLLISLALIALAQAALACPPPEDRSDERAALHTRLLSARTEAEADRKLKVCEAKHATSEAEAAKKLEECLEDLKKEQAALLKKTEFYNELQEAKDAMQDKFTEAARAACQALGPYQAGR